MLGLLYGALLHQSPLYELRKEHKLTPEDPRIEGRPELVLATQALGGFRAILVDVLWLRAIRLQKAQKFWELAQLTDWICKLEPRIPKVWVFNSWNMSYNILAEVPTSEERWSWLWRAIRLILDQGLKYNPNSPDLYKELSKIFFHKIGKYTDEHNRYYKHRLALLMHGVFGSGDPDIEAFAAAPRTKEELLNNDAVRDLAQEYRALGVEPGRLVEDYFPILYE